MKAGSLHFNLVESYLALLQSLSSESKKELISRLSETPKVKKVAAKKDIRTLFGSFVSNLSADEQIEEIRKSRNFTRTTERL